MSARDKASATQQRGSVVDQVRRAIEIADSEAAAGTFIARFDEDALHVARELDRGALPAFRQGPRVVTIKANIAVAGHVTCAGSLALADNAPESCDARALVRLRKAGFVPFGHTNMTELAFSGLGVNPHYGTPDNPAVASRGHIPGGSSSGAAVSVALGIAPVAIGTDTGGSVRIPAAFCGLVGFKPTASAVSREGVVPLSPTLDTVGVIGREVADCRAVFDAMREPAGPQMRFTDHRLHFGLLDNYVLDGIDDAVAAAYDRAVADLADAGAIITPCSFPELDGVPEMQRHATFAAYESHASFAALIRDRGAMIDPFVKARIEAGSGMSAGAYETLCAERLQLIDALRAHAAQFDALLMPTVPIAPPTLAIASDPEHFTRLNALVLRNSTWINLADGCAISLPCHREGDMPVGLTLLQRGGADTRLLDIAALVSTILTSRRQPRRS